MTAQEFGAGAIERAAAQLAHYLDQTVADKRDWTPTLDGAAGLRSALDQVAECISVNARIATVLRGGEFTAPGGERPFTDAADAQAKLVSGAKDLSDAILALSDDALNRNYTTPFGPFPGYLLMDTAIRNTHYHAGQINQLQLCYGDTKFDFFPPKKD